MCAIVMILFVIKLCIPSVYNGEPKEVKSIDETGNSDSIEVAEVPEVEETSDAPVKYDLLTIAPPQAIDFSYRHRVRGILSYDNELHDVQDVQYPSARKWGVPPIDSRAELEGAKSSLVYIGASPYYIIGRQMQHSIPYLVPRASHLLQHIGRCFIDSLAAKQLPLHTIVVTSALRTEQDANRLRRTNGNASEQSCHRFGTTIDISYRSFYDVARNTQDPTAEVQERLKMVLSEVLRDARKQGLCWVMYERKQACFHITVR